MGYSPWGCKESDTTEPLTLTLFSVNCWLKAPWSRDCGTHLLESRWTDSKLIPSVSVVLPLQPCAHVAVVPLLCFLV